MGYMNEFPHSKMFDSDLRQILELYSTVKGLPVEWETYKKLMDTNFADLKDFVNNYFKNLDVQDEINNKIDELIANDRFFVDATMFIEDRSLTIDKMAIGTLGYVTPQMFEAKGDGLTNDTNALQNAIDYAIDNHLYLYLPKGKYLIGEPLTINDATLTIIGAGTVDTYILCWECDGFVTNTPHAIIMKDFAIAQAIRYTNENPNNFTGIKIQGADDKRPTNYVIENLFLDGFQKGITCSYIWNARFKDIKMNFCLTGIEISGLSVNNEILCCSISGAIQTEGYGIIFSEAHGSEGWIIRDNVICGFQYGIVLFGVANIFIDTNIIDFIYSYGIATFSTTLFSGNHHIVNNYIAIVGANFVGISLQNNIDNPQIKGSIISNNRILSYENNGGKGIEIIGSNEQYNIVSGNNVSNFTIAAINITNDEKNIITSNVFLGYTYIPQNSINQNNIIIN